MHILIVNDDGIHSEGLAALESAAYAVTDRVSVVAPLVEQSAQSHAITVRKPIMVDRLTHPTNLVRCSVEGTPADCTRLGILELCDEKPDLVLSGINHGGNMGWEIFFSGTIAAAAEAYSFGIPGIAFSLATWNKAGFQSAERIAAKMLQEILKGDVSHPMLYNINIPPFPYNEIKGVRITRQEPNVKGDSYVSRQTPDGRTYYWATWGDRFDRSAELTDPDYDVVAVREGYVSLTRLNFEVSVQPTDNGSAGRFRDITFS